MLLPTRITILVVTIIMLISVTFSSSIWVTLNNSTERFENSTKEGRSDLWKKVISSQTEVMINNTSTLIRDRATKKALKKRKMESLSDSASTTFNLLSASNVISRLQITDKSGDVLFSSPVSFTGKSRKTIISKAVTEGKVVSTIERDDDGKLLNFVVFPLSTRGKIIGTGVYAKDLNQAINEFKRINKSDVFIMGPSGEVDYYTDEKLLQSLNLKITEMQIDSALTIEVDESFLSVIKLPILDGNGEIIANFITAKDFTKSYEQQQFIFLVSTSITVIIVTLSLFAVYFYMSNVLKPLGTTVKELEKISEGDLSFNIKVDSEDEIGSLKKGMQNTVIKLREIVSQMISMTEELGSTTSNIGDSASLTRNGVHKEQDELAQLTTAITQMTVTVQEVARNAHEAAASTETSDMEAKNGQRLVHETIVSIQNLAEEIDHSNKVVGEVESDSNAIGAIIDTIKAIAEQTNLLALNAAIEAARAGEQGRGFAVVADEVRSLASRTQDSTQQIQEMIENLQSKVQKTSHAMLRSQEKVKESVSIAEESGKSLNVITDVVANISDMMIQIATAAEQQAKVSEELNKSAVNINNISIESSKGVDIIFKETAQLTGVSNKLKEIVNKFTI